MPRVFSCDTKRPLSTKDTNETGIFRLLALFLKIWKMGERYRTDKMGNKADPCPIPTSTLKNGEEKLFHKYWIFLPTK